MDAARFDSALSSQDAALLHRAAVRDEASNAAKLREDYRRVIHTYRGAVLKAVALASEAEWVLQDAMRAKKEGIISILQHHGILQIPRELHEAMHEAAVDNIWDALNMALGRVGRVRVASADVAARHSAAEAGKKAAAAVARPVSAALPKPVAMPTPAADPTPAPDPALGRPKKRARDEPPRSLDDYIKQRDTLINNMMFLTNAAAQAAVKEFHTRWADFDGVPSEVLEANVKSMSAMAAKPRVAIGVKNWTERKLSEIKDYSQSIDFIRRTQHVLKFLKSLAGEHFTETKLDSVITKVNAAYALKAAPQEPDAAEGMTYEYIRAVLAKDGDMLNREQFESAIAKLRLRGSARLGVEADVSELWKLHYSRNYREPGTWLREQMDSRRARGAHDAGETLALLESADKVFDTLHRLAPSFVRPPAVDEYWAAAEASIVPPPPPPPPPPSHGGRRRRSRSRPQPKRPRSRSRSHSRSRAPRRHRSQPRSRSRSRPRSRAQTRRR